MRHPLTFGSTNPRPTADLTFSLFYKSDAAWNETGWKNPRFDQLLIAARGETNEANRKAMYGEMQKIVHDQCGSIIPVFISLLDGHDRRFHDRPLIASILRSIRSSCSEGGKR
jgi:peptide/nickel transport system substrate-binding protein